jgi:2'-5' RNA ligase
VLLAYVILLPDDAHNFMRRVQAEIYDRYEASLRTLRLEPHVTLKQPFEATDVGPHEAFLDRLAAETEPFELVLRDFGFWEDEHEGGIVFLDLEQDERLTALQRAILDDLELEPADYESGNPMPYHFHATIGAGLSPDDLADARTRLADTPTFRFELERLALFRRAEDRPWIVYKRAKL